MIRKLLGYIPDLLFMAHDVRELKGSVKKLTQELTDLTKLVEKLTLENEY